MSIIFDSQIDFEKAVMKVLHERLKVHVIVDRINMGQETRVKVSLTDEYSGCIDSDEDQA